MKGLLARRPSPALIVAIVALVCALTGTAWAALGKNSVGSKQLKKNAVTAAKIKKEAVTSAKVKKHTLTGKNINLAKLGTVPSATNATNAGTASALTPPEAVHYVGTAGQPPFASKASNVPPGLIEEEFGPSVKLRSVGFYKDHEGIVHLEGLAAVEEVSGTVAPVVFQLPQGFRPAANTALTFPNVEGGGVVAVVGSGVNYQGHDYSGDVVLTEEGIGSLNGITFRAEG